MSGIGQLHSLLADAIVILHLAFVAFVVLGGLLLLRWPRVAWVHVPAAVWGVWIEVSGGICPLTPLENRLRSAAGEAVYDVSFVERYLLPVLYPAALSRELQWTMAAIVLMVNVAIYIVVLRRRAAA